jgi:Putative zinc-finger
VTLPDVHLADEAVAAFVDDGLSPAARARARRHLRDCAECRAVVEAQREAKLLLAASPDPCLPAGLVARLRDIPMTTDLGVDDIVLAVDGGELAWAPAPRSGSEPPGRGRPSRPAGPGSSRPSGGASGGPGAFGGSGAAYGAPDATGGRGASDGSGSPGSPRVAGLAFPGDAKPGGSARRPGRVRDRRDGRPGSYPSSSPSRRLLRGRRMLAGAIAGIAFGVIASAAASPQTGIAQPGRVDQGGSTTAPPVEPASFGSQLDASTLRLKSDEGTQASVFTVSRSSRER